jgi:hypothetical protein
VNEDRLLVIASAEIELLLFDLTWIEDQSKNGDQFQNDQVDSECPPKRQTQALLVGADYIEESSDQANVRYFWVFYF